MSLIVYSHQQLQAIEDEVGVKTGEKEIRLDWMPDEELFDVGAFVLKQLKGFHAVLCAQHVHAPTNPPSGENESACAYCSYGHKFTKANNFSPPVLGVQI